MLAQRCTNSCYSCLKVAQRTNCYNACSAAWADGRDKSQDMNPENEFKICGLSGGELKHVNCHSGAWSVASSPVGPWQTQRNFGVHRCSYGNAKEVVALHLRCSLVEADSLHLLKVDNVGVTGVAAVWSLLPLGPDKY